MNIDPRLFDFSKPISNKSLLERFNDTWFFDMPERGVVIYQNALFFNDIFLNRYGFSLLARLIENGMIFAYDKTNTEKFQQFKTFDELKTFFTETPDYQKYRYVYAKKTNSIFADFITILAYKKTHKMVLNNE